MKNPGTSTRDSAKPGSEQEEPFLRRWSKRKLGASTATEESVEAAHELMPASDQQQSKAKLDDAIADQPQRELTDDDMPPLETLDENSDYSGFFSPRVSEGLRRQALRKLFHFKQFNITDGLNDYDEDYTNFEKLGNIVTHEMKRLLEREAKAAEEKILDSAGEQVTATQVASQADNDGESEMQAETMTENMLTDVEEEEGLIDHNTSNK